MIWTDEKVEQLKLLWQEGFTAQEIADKIGDGATRNMVVGKAHRVGCPRRAPSAAAPKPRTKGMTPNLVAAHAAIKEKADARLAERKMIDGKASGEPTKMIDLQNHQCRWPIGHPGTADFHFCGAHRCAGPYCEQHARIAYNRP